MARHRIPHHLVEFLFCVSAREDWLAKGPRAKTTLGRLFHEENDFVHATSLLGPRGGGKLGLPGRLENTGHLFRRTGKLDVIGETDGPQAAPRQFVGVGASAAGTSR